MTALFKLARHVETDPITIDQLVGYAIEGMAIQAAAPTCRRRRPAGSI